MSSPLALEVEVSQPLVLGEPNRAEILLTISSQGDHPLYLQARVEAPDPYLSAVFTFSGGAERHLPGGEAVTLRLQIAPPPYLRPGRYEFKLVVEDLENPGNPLAESQPLFFEVTREPTAPLPKPPFLSQLPVRTRNILIVVAALVVMAVVAFFVVRIFFSPKEPLPFELGGRFAGADNRVNDWLQVAGMTWGSMEIDLSEESPDLTPENISEAQATIAAWHERGQRLMITVRGDSAALARSPERYYRTFARTLARLAETNVDAIEVWTGQNVDPNWPVGMINSQEYTRLLREAHNAVKSVNPNIMVISGAPIPTSYFAEGCTPLGCNDVDFLRGMVQAGAMEFVDCVGIRYNEGIVSPSATSGDSRWNSAHYSHYFEPLIDQYASVIPDKPLCFTDLGYLTFADRERIPPGYSWTASTSLDDQAQWLAEAVALAKDHPRIRLAIVNSLTPVGPLGNGYAIVRDGDCRACPLLREIMGVVLNEPETPTETITLHYGLPDTELILDGIRTTDPAAMQVIHQGCEGLVRFDPGDEAPQPALATAWESDARGITWTFTLREGVTFHDGTPFNAEAVAVNVQRWLANAADFRVFQMAFTGVNGEPLIRDVDVSGDYEIVLRLRQPMAPLFHNLAMPAFSIVSPTALEAFGSNYGDPTAGGYVCTGPYRFAQAAEGTIVQERFADWWNESSGNVDQIIWQSMADPRQRFEAVVEGVVDVIDQPDADTLRQATGEETPGNIRAVAAARPLTVLLALDQRISEFQDPQVRRAIASFIDRDGMTEAVYGSAGQSASGFLPPDLSGGSGPPRVPFGPEFGRALLAEIGFPDGLREVHLGNNRTIPLTLYTPATSQTEQLAEYIASQLSEFGIQVKVEPVDPANYLERYLTGDFPGLVVVVWPFNNGDADSLLGYAFGPKPGPHLYYDPGLRQNVHSARREVDPRLRQRFYEVAEATLAKAVGVLFLAYETPTAIVRPEVQNFMPGNLWDVVFER